MDRVEIYFQGKMLARGQGLRPRIRFYSLEYPSALQFAEEVYTVYFQRLNRSSCSADSGTISPESKERVCRE